jgi:DNA-binding transcriptional LysR family regulator
MATNIPTDLLRSFVTVIDLGGFTPAAKALGRTQPAISLQIRRLEELLQTELIQTSGRTFKVTDAGMALGPYARQMLRLNDDVVTFFSDATMTGWIRVGVPTDFAHALLLDAIAGFAATHPDVKIEIESQLSTDLLEGLSKDRFDICVAIAPEATDKDTPFLVEDHVIQPFWCVSEDFSLDPDAPLPILRHPAPCEYADRMREALDRINRKWHTSLISRDVAGLQTAARAGLGATALTPATYLSGMRIPTVEEGFPLLAPLRIGLFYKHAALSQAGHGLAQHLLQHIQTAKKHDAA